MDEEIEVLKNYIEDLKFFKDAHITFFTWKIHNHNIILCKSGIGKVNATISTTLLIKNFQPDYILNTGSAGAINNTLKVGDIVVWEKIFHHNADATIFWYEKWQIPKMQKYFLSDQNLINIHKQDSQNNENFSIFQWTIASGNQFISHKNERERLQKYFPELLAVEMESAAIAQTCTLFNIPFLIIRSISDNADGNSHISFNEFLSIASKNSSNIILNIIKNPY